MRACVCFPFFGNKSSSWKVKQLVLYLLICTKGNLFFKYLLQALRSLFVSGVRFCHFSDNRMTYNDLMKLQITYSGAILEACMRKLVFYPEIVGFIEEEKDKFPTVRVQYVFNSPPKLIMLDEEGQHKETIR